MKFFRAGWMYIVNLRFSFQSAGAGSQTQDSRGHRAGLQGQVPAEIWQEGEQ